MKYGRKERGHYTGGKVQTRPNYYKNSLEPLITIIITITTTVSGSSSVHKRGILATVLYDVIDDSFSPACVEYAFLTR